MKRVAFAVPGGLDTPTGGYAYDKRMIAELRALGWQVDVIDLGHAFPNPDAAERTTALARLGAVAAAQPIVLDGLAFGVMADEAEVLSRRHPLVALVHHPLALETGIDRATARALRTSERAALAWTRAVVVTSAATGEILRQDFAVPAARICVIRPAVDRPRKAAARTVGDRVHLLAVGAVTPRKGYDLLIEALSDLKNLDWHLTVAGDTERAPATSACLQAAIARLDLQSRITLIGAVGDARLAELYRAAGVFVHASRFEGYGMVLGEAIAHGLPVISTAVGAAREIVPSSAGLLVEPGDASALRGALRRLIGEPGLRGQLARGADVAARALPEWRDSARQLARVLEELA